MNNTRSKLLLCLLIAALLSSFLGIYAGQRFWGARQAEQFRKDAQRQAVNRLFALPLQSINSGEETRITTLNQWQGKILLINFWATWCAPCRQEIPAFSLLSQKYVFKNVQFIGIAVDSAANVQAFKQKIAISYPVFTVSAEAIELMEALGNKVGGLPFTLILRPDKTVELVKLGLFPSESLQENLNKLITERVDKL